MRLTVLLGLAALAATAQPVRVRMDTAAGRIELEVDTVRAPATAANFLRYVEAGHYDGGLFHRTVTASNQPDDAVRIEVIQAAVNPARQNEGWPAIPLERTSSTGLRHRDGTLSMARTGPDTATSHFFICIGDQPELDFGGRRNPDGQGFAAFGRVVSGRDVVRRIHQSPARGQRLTPPVPIRSARRIGAAQPFHSAELLFPLEHWHNHASSVVELPDGDLFACWYNGSGERRADDVKVEAARLPKGSRQWSPRFTLADTPAFPDTNPALFLDSRKRLWLFWQIILANEWHSALTAYRIASQYDRQPRWEVSENLLFVPRNFTEKARAGMAHWPASPYRDRQMERAGDKFFSRLGWMTRVHPLELPSGRILVPLYSDGYDFSLVAITDDGGRTWSSSEPIVGLGAVQPALVRRRNGSIVAYMRDNGPPPKRVLIAESRDQGETWTAAVDTDIPNPGSGLEVIALRDGTWVMILNDTERGRHSLAVWLSDDEGRSWRWKRRLEFDGRAERAASFHYPSILQARDGTLHATYSYFLNHVPEGQPRKAIKHAHFNTEWIRQGNSPKPH